MGWLRERGLGGGYGRDGDLFCAGYMVDLLVCLDTDDLLKMAMNLIQSSSAQSGF